jgi:hypothetical protein
VDLSSFMVNFFQCGIAFGVFAELGILDHRQGNGMPVHFCVVDLHAGQAVERSQRPQCQAQRLTQVGQTPGSPPLDLDRTRQNDAPNCVQIQRKTDRRPA